MNAFSKHLFDFMADLAREQFSPAMPVTTALPHPPAVSEQEPSSKVQEGGALWSYDNSDMEFAAWHARNFQQVRANFEQQYPLEEDYCIFVMLEHDAEKLRIAREGMP